MMNSCQIIAVPLYRPQNLGSTHLNHSFGLQMKNLDLKAYVYFNEKHIKVGNKDPTQLLFNDTAYTP